MNHFECNMNFEAHFLLSYVDGVIKFLIITDGIMNKIYRNTICVIDKSTLNNLKYFKYYLEHLNEYYNRDNSK